MKGNLDRASKHLKKNLYLNFSSLIELNRNWNFSLSDSFQFFEGRQNLYSFNAEKDYSNPFNYFESLKNFSQDKWLFGNNKFKLGFSNVKSIKIYINGSEGLLESFQHTENIGKKS